METEALLESMKAYAVLHHIPIIEAESMSWLQQFLLNKKISNVLEIGGAIGYSTIYWQYLTEGHVVSIERDAARYMQGQLYLQSFNHNEQVTFIHGDAKDVAFFNAAKQAGPYDILFIDATKRQNQHFFELFAELVVPGGYIITDNMNFRGLVSADTTTLASLPRRVRPMVRAVIAYKQWLIEHPHFTTEFVTVGDGLAISQKIY